MLWLKWDNVDGYQRITLRLRGVVNFGNKRVLRIHASCVDYEVADNGYYVMHITIIRQHRCEHCRLTQKLCNNLSEFRTIASKPRPECLASAELPIDESDAQSIV